MTLRGSPFRNVEGNKIKTIGILTGGGDCPGLNAVIRAVTKSATLNYSWKVIGILDGFEGLIEKKYIELSYDSVRAIIDRGGTILGSSNKANPFDYKIQKNGKVESEDVSGKIIENVGSLNIDALAIAGGDGTLTIANKLNKKGINTVGIPKTIDNDLSGTDRTFGFDTAVNTAVEALDKIRTTAESHHRAMVVEVMGRYAGWIALYSGLASGADIILIPEIPYNPKKVFETIKSRMEKQRNYTIVVVAEGAKPKGGAEVVKMILKDSAEARRLGGIAVRLAAEIREKAGISSRATILGHIQRGGTPSALDRSLGTRLGFHATTLISSGQFGMMAAIRGNEITSVPIEQAVQGIRKVNPKGDLVNCARGLGVSFGD